MSVGDRKLQPTDAVTGAPYAPYEVTDETVVGGYRQAAILVKHVDDSGGTVTPGDATAAKQDTGNASLATIATNTGAPTPAGTNNIGDVDVLTLPGSSTANVPSIATATGTVISANAARKSWAIQNVGTNVLFVRLGASASATVFHFALKGGTVDSDGLGAVISNDVWQGIVSVFGTSPKYTVTELT
jgi:hypothetical protein